MPEDSGWVSSCPEGQPVLPNHWLPSAAQVLVCFLVPVLCVSIHNKVLEKLIVLKTDI